MSHELGIKNAMNFDATEDGTIYMSKSLSQSRERRFSKIANDEADEIVGFFDK